MSNFILVHGTAEKKAAAGFPFNLAEHHKKCEKGIKLTPKIFYNVNRLVLCILPKRDNRFLLQPASVCLAKVGCCFFNDLFSSHPARSSALNSFRDA